MNEKPFLGHRHDLFFKPFCHLRRADERDTFCSFETDFDGKEMIQ